MKDTSNRPPQLEKFMEWWDDLEPSEKVSFVWLSIVATVVVVVGLIFPEVGLIFLGAAAFFGTIVAIVTLGLRRW